MPEQINQQDFPGGRNEMSKGSWKERCQQTRVACLLIAINGTSGQFKVTVIDAA